MVAMYSGCRGIVPGGGLPTVWSCRRSGIMYMSSSPLVTWLPAGLAGSGEGEWSTNLVCGGLGGSPPDPPAASSGVPFLKAGSGTSFGRVDCR